MPYEKLEGEYTENISEVIGNCQGMIEIIGNNLSSIGNLEIIKELQQARKEGVAIALYYNNAGPLLVSTFKKIDIEVYRGSKQFDPEGYEYIIADFQFFTPMTGIGYKALKIKFVGDEKLIYSTTDLDEVTKLSDDFDKLLESDSARESLLMSKRHRTRFKLTK